MVKNNSDIEVSFKIWILKDFLLENYTELIKANSEKEWVDYEGGEGIYNGFTDWDQLFSNDLDNDILEHFLSDQ